MVLVICVVFSISLLGACDELKDAKKVLKEENFEVKNIDFTKKGGGFLEFTEYQVIVDTDQETIISNLYYSTFKKTDGETKVHAEWIEEGEMEYIELVVEVNKDEVSPISKKYANEFNETMEFVD